MTTKSFDPRKLMELAVDVMVKSKQEPRSDGKASPLVGAVLWNNAATDTASRSELRDGDHAEFTLLERKHRTSKLDDAVLFSTLEPCAPGSRKHPKLSFHTDILFLSMGKFNHSFCKSHIFIVRQMRTIYHY